MKGAGDGRKRGDRDEPGGADPHRRVAGRDGRWPPHRHPPRLAHDPAPAASGRVGSAPADHRRRARDRGAAAEAAKPRTETGETRPAGNQAAAEPRRPRSLPAPLRHRRNRIGSRRHRPPPPRWGRCRRRRRRGQARTARSPHPRLSALRPAAPPAPQARAPLRAGPRRAAHHVPRHHPAAPAAAATAPAVARRSRQRRASRPAPRLACRPRSRTCRARPAASHG